MYCEIGQRTRVYEVMRGARPLSLNMIRNLHRKLEIPAEILIQPERKPSRHRVARAEAEPRRCASEGGRRAVILRPVTFSDAGSTPAASTKFHAGIRRIMPTTQPAERGRSRADLVPLVVLQSCRLDQERTPACQVADAEACPQSRVRSAVPQVQDIPY